MTAVAAAAAPKSNGAHPLPPSKTPPKFVASQLLAVDAIEADPHNPRKDFPKEQMNELISSIMLYGVRQPVEVRQLGSGRYRIVAGERRWRATKAAGLKDIPAIVRTLTDLEAAEVQLEENIKRADLSPLEVAGGYQRLLELGRTIDQVCERVGKKRSVVYGMVHMLKNLGPEGRKSLGEEKIDLSKAQLVASYAKSVQAKAVSLIEPNHWGERPNYKNAKATLERELLVDLKKAPWKLNDATVPCVAKDCASCPMRTGNQPELFPDIKNGDTCTDPASFRKKLYAHARAGVEKAGMKLLKPEDAPAEKLFWNGGRGPVNPESGYVDPSERCHDDSQNRPYQQLLTPEQRQKLIMVALDVDGKQRHVLERAGLMREVKKAGLIKTRKVGKTTTTRSTSTRDSSPKDPARYRDPPPSVDDLVEKAGAAKVVELLAKKGITPALLKQVLLVCVGRSEYFDLPDNVGRWNLDEKKFDRLYPKANLDSLTELLVRTTIVDDALCMGGGVDKLLKTNGVDEKKVRAEVEKTHPVRWSEDKHGATGEGKKLGTVVIGKKGKNWTFTAPKDVAKLELSFDSVEKAKATALKVELGQAVWAPAKEDEKKQPVFGVSLKELVKGKSAAVAKAVAKHAATKKDGAK